MGIKNGDPNASMTLLVGIVGTIIVFAIIVGLQALYNRVEETENYNKIYSQAPEELSRVRAEQQELLNSYRWIDRDKDVVGIPIDRAMELTERELAAPQAALPQPAASGATKKQ